MSSLLVKSVPLFITTWALAGLGAVLGSILGNAVGRTGLIAGAVVGGIAGIAGAVAIGTWRRWLPPGDRTGGFLGATAGFAVAAPIAVTNLQTPITPVLICGLAGVGLLLGAGVARGWRGEA